MNKDKCLCKPTEVLIFPCSGGSNVGQITKRSRKKLTAHNIGKMYCLAGIGGHASGYVEATQEVRKKVLVLKVSRLLVHEKH